MSAANQLELNGKCLLKDLNRLDFKKLKFHWAGFRRAMRQSWREFWGQLK